MSQELLAVCDPLLSMHDQRRESRVVEVFIANRLSIFP